MFRPASALSVLALCLLPGFALAGTIAGGDLKFLKGTNEMGLKFLEENKGRPGVVTLASGLQYKVLTEGIGEDHPMADSNCKLDYAGTTPKLTPDAIDKNESDWKCFHSTYHRPKHATFAPNHVISGWTEAMQLMVEGDKWELYIPADLGYGDDGSNTITGPRIEGGDVLIVRMEILAIQGERVPADRCDVETLKGCHEKKTKYLAKQGKATPEERKAEMKRLEGMQGGEMEPEKKQWLDVRVRVLQKLLQKTTTDEL